MLYSILAEKTQLSFTCSNSSFTECVRRHSSSPHYLSLFSTNSECDGPSYEGCPFTGTHRTPTSTTSFTRCTFSNILASGDNGGAICCTISSVNITLQSCSIINCNSTKNGGGVYVEGDSTTLSVDNTVFHECITTSQETHPGGGGICMKGSSSLTVSSASFIGCKANVEIRNRGGGGIFASQIKDCSITSSRFVSCSTVTTGGAVFFWNLSAEFSVCDTVLKGNYAKYSGAGLREHSNSHSDCVHLTFLFFSDNTNPDDRGNDLLFLPQILKSPSLYCFSTTTKGVCIEDSSGNIKSISGSDEWLPLGTLSQLDVL